MRWIALVALCAACGGDGSTEGDGSYVGRTVPPLPDGLSSAGMQAFPPDSTGAWGLDLVFGPARQMLWLTRAPAGADPAGERTVEAVLEIPQGEADVNLVYAPGACSASDMPGTIVALARVQFGPELTDIVRAWSVDRAAGTFTPFPAEGVACRNPAHPQ